MQKTTSAYAQKVLLSMEKTKMTLEKQMKETVRVASHRAYGVKAAQVVKRVWGARL
jgi:hypothetical protein